MVCCPLMLLSFLCFNNGKPQIVKCNVKKLPLMTHPFCIKPKSMNVHVSYNWAHLYGHVVFQMYEVVKVSVWHIQDMWMKYEDSHKCHPGPYWATLFLFKRLAHIIQPLTKYIIITKYSTYIIFSKLSLNPLYSND